MLQVLMAVSLFSFSTMATHLDSVCKTAITHPPLFSEGIMARSTLENRNVVEAMDGTQITEVTEKIHSVLSQGEKIWVATNSGLLEFDKSGHLLKSHDVTFGRNLVLAGDALVIVRSGGVLTALNSHTGEILWTSWMADVPGGRAMSAGFDGQNLQVAFSTSFEFGFSGVATINPHNGEVMKATPYESRRFGVISPDAKARWFNGQLVLNNGGWIHVITPEQINSGRPIRPRWVAHVLGSRNNPYYMSLQGEFYFEDSYLVGCGRYRDMTSGHGWELKTALFKVKI